MSMDMLRPRCRPLAIVLLLAALLLNSAPVWALTQAAAPLITLVAPAEPWSDPTRVAVELRVSSASELAGFELTLAFDHSRVELVRFTPSTALGALEGCDETIQRCSAVLGPHIVKGQARLGVYAYGPGEGLSGDGLLGTFQLRLLHPTDMIELAATDILVASSDGALARPANVRLQIGFVAPGAPILQEPPFATCPANTAELATLTGTLRQDKSAQRSRSHPVTLTKAANITVVGFAQEGHPEQCPGGLSCGQGQRAEEFSVSVGAEWIGAHYDRSDNDPGTPDDAWYPAGPWSTSEKVGPAEIAVSVTHLQRGSTAESVSYKLTICGDASVPASAAVETKASLSSGAAQQAECRDFTDDGAVDLADLLVLAERWRWTAASPGWESRFDLDHDAAITIGDLAILADSFGSCSDTVAPRMVSVTLNDGAATTSEQEIRIQVEVADASPSSGVRDLKIVESIYRPGIGRPTPVAVSEWLPYRATPTSIAWKLSDQAGFKYIEVRARDRAGNLSRPLLAIINYLPLEETVGADEARVYRFTLQAGEQLVAELQPLVGDVDLFVWGTSNDKVRLIAFSNGSDGLDQIDFVSPRAGIYQLEVVAVTAARYNLRLVDAQNVAGSQAAIDNRKALPAAPLLPLPRAPEGEKQHYQVHLPFIAR